MYSEYSLLWALFIRELGEYLNREHKRMIAFSDILVLESRILSNNLPYKKILSFSSIDILLFRIFFSIIPNTGDSSKIYMIYIFFFYK